MVKIIIPHAKPIVLEKPRISSRKIKLIPHYFSSGNTDCPMILLHAATPTFSAQAPMSQHNWEIWMSWWNLERTCTNYNFLSKTSSLSRTTHFVREVITISYDVQFSPGKIDFPIILFYAPPPSLLHRLPWVKTIGELESPKHNLNQ